ncbi:hypothetical protein YC2023_089828 [Brassica napus]
MVNFQILFSELKEGHCREKGFKHLLKQGSFYELTVFDVTRSIQNFRFADAPVSIRFVEQTSFVDISASNNPSPTKSFRFCKFRPAIVTGEHKH